MNKTEHNFCQNIRYLKRKHSLTQKEMAEILGICVSTLRRMEQETEVPRIHCRMLSRACDYFDLSADEMIYTALEE